jgi:hypothetical protein
MLSEKKWVYVLSFFSFAGYYLGLALILSFGYLEFSRYYSIPLRISLMIIMLMLILKNIHRGVKQFSEIYPALLVIFSMLYIIKVIISEANYSKFLSRSWYEYIFYFISYSLLPFITFSSINFEKYKKTILNAFIFCGFVLSVLSLYLYRNILTMGLGRISMIKYEFPKMETLSPLTLSYCGVLTIVLCVYKLIYQKTNGFKQKAYFYITIILSFVIFFLGASRGSLVALLLSFTFLIYHASTRNRSRILILCVVALPLIMYGVEATGSAIFIRTEELIETGEAGGRLELWSKAFEEFKNNPILGGRIEVSGIYPHNIFLEILMATGIIGFTLFSIVFIKSVKKGLNLIKKDKYYMFPFLILITGITLNMFSGSVYDAILLFISMGMLFSKPKLITSTNYTHQTFKE